MAQWEGREASLSWGLGSRPAGVFLELSFPSASSEQVKNPTEGPSRSPPPLPPPPSACLIPHAGRGEVRPAVWGMQERGVRRWGSIIPDPFPPALYSPSSPSKSLREERAFQVEGMANAKAVDSGCGGGESLQLGWNRGWGGPLGLLSGEELV